MVNLVMVQFGLTDFDISVIGMGDFYSRDCDLGISDINVRFGLVNFLSWFKPIKLCRWCLTTPGQVITTTQPMITRTMILGWSSQTGWGQGKNIWSLLWPLHSQSSSYSYSLGNNSYGWKVPGRTLLNNMHMTFLNPCSLYCRWRDKHTQEGTSWYFFTMYK